MLIIACLLIASAAAAPSVFYDQRQEGDFNLRTDVKNVLFVAVPPQTLKIPPAVADILLEGLVNVVAPLFLKRSDTPGFKSFVEPNTPYLVDIGGGSESRDAEVLIAGRRRLEDESHIDGDEYKLLGATEQCGPDGERDPVSLVCRTKLKSEPTQDAKTLVAPQEISDEKLTPVEKDPAPAPTS